MELVVQTTPRSIELGSSQKLGRSESGGPKEFDYDSEFRDRLRESTAELESPPAQQTEKKLNRDRETVSTEPNAQESQVDPNLETSPQSSAVVVLPSVLNQGGSGTTAGQAEGEPPGKSGMIGGPLPLPLKPSSEENAVLNYLAEVVAQNVKGEYIKAPLKQPIMDQSLAMKAAEISEFSDDLNIVAIRVEKQPVAAGTEGRTSDSATTMSTLDSGLSDFSGETPGDSKGGPPGSGVLIGLAGKADSSSVDIASSAKADAITAAELERSIQNKQVLEQVSNRIEHLAAKRSTETVTIHLSPANLGQVVLTVTQSAEGLMATMGAEQDRTREILLNNRAELIQNLEQKGMTVKSVTVQSMSEAQTGDRSGFGSSSQQSPHQQQSQLRQEQNPHGFQSRRDWSSEVSLIEANPRKALGIDRVDLEV